MSKHAFLSASSSNRWLNCPPSAKLNAEAEQTTSAYARQGTDCHELCAYLVEAALGRDVTDPTENLDYYDQEMQQCAEEYRNFVLEQIEKAKTFCSDPQVMIEQRLDFSRWVPDGFGTGDCVIVADEELQIIDYKHGVGVLVDADHNSQMMCYALGAIELFDGIYDIEKVQMTIFQPRRDNVSTWSISKEELLSWAENTLRPIAEVAINGEGEFKAGDHCQFCAVKATCRKRAEYNLELVENAIEFDSKSKAAITTAMVEMTGLENPNSVLQMHDWLQSKGIQSDSLDKKAVRELLQTVPSDVADVLKLRQQLAKSSVKKYQAMQNPRGSLHLS